MVISVVRGAFVGLMAAGALTAGAAEAANAAEAALAFPPIACQPIPGAPLPSNICTTVNNGLVRGFANYFGTGTVTPERIFIYQCDAAQTSCTLVPGSRVVAMTTPSLPAAAGANYKTCVSFSVRVGLLDIRHYSGCSPLASALP